MTALWLVERTTSARFPYRVSIEQHGRLLFAVRAQARWPGQRRGPRRPVDPKA